MAKGIGKPTPKYRVWQKVTFGERAWAMVADASAIVAEYAAQGISLTARSIHYQFVARGLEVHGAQFDPKGRRVDGGPYLNSFKNYKVLCDVLNRAKLGGWLPWDIIQDMNREVTEAPSFGGPEEFMTDYARYVFKLDMWAGQEARLMVGVEKDALVGVIDNVCRRYRVPYISLRGYSSGTALYNVGRKFHEYACAGQYGVFLHIGDHDPSGLDMTRDNRERLTLFSDENVSVKRIALTAAQIERYEPPPNFAKDTDGRYESYVAEHGTSCYEADALDPAVLAKTIEDSIVTHIDLSRWEADAKREKSLQGDLDRVGRHWMKALRAAK